MTNKLFFVFRFHRPVQSFDINFQTFEGTARLDRPINYLSYQCNVLCKCFLHVSLSLSHSIARRGQTPWRTKKESFFWCVWRESNVNKLSRPSHLFSCTKISCEQRRNETVTFFFCSRLKLDNRCLYARNIWPNCLTLSKQDNKYKAIAH